MLGTIQGRRVWTEPKKKLGKQRECWRSQVEVGDGYLKMMAGGWQRSFLREVWEAERLSE